MQKNGRTCQVWNRKTSAFGHSIITKLDNLHLNIAAKNVKTPPLQLSCSRRGSTRSWNLWSKRPFSTTTRWPTFQQFDWRHHAFYVYVYIGCEFLLVKKSRKPMILISGKRFQKKAFSCDELLYSVCADLEWINAWISCMGEILLLVSINDSFDHFLKPSWFSRVQDGNGVRVSGSSVINGLMNVGTISWFSKNSFLLLHQIMEVGKRMHNGKRLVSIHSAFKMICWRDFVVRSLCVDILIWIRDNGRALRLWDVFFGRNADKAGHSVSEPLSKSRQKRDGFID